MADLDEISGMHELLLPTRQVWGEAAPHLNQPEPQGVQAGSGAPRSRLVIYLVIPKTLIICQTYPTPIRTTTQSKVL